MVSSKRSVIWVYFSILLLHPIQTISQGIPYLLIEEENNYAVDIDFDFTNQLAASVHNNKFLRIWNIPDYTLKDIITINAGEEGFGQLTRCALDPKGRYAIVSGKTGTDRNNFAIPAKGLYSFYIVDLIEKKPINKIGAFDTEITSMSFSPNGNILFVTSGYEYGSFFDGRDMRYLNQLFFEDEYILKSFFIDDSSLVIITDYRIYLYEIKVFSNRDIATNLLKRKRIRKSVENIFVSWDKSRVGFLKRYKENFQVKYFHTNDLHQEKRGFIEKDSINTLFEEGFVQYINKWWIEDTNLGSFHTSNTYTVEASNTKSIEELFYKIERKDKKTFDRFDPSTGIIHYLYADSIICQFDLTNYHIETYKDTIPANPTSRFKIKKRKENLYEVNSISFFTNDLDQSFYYGLATQCKGHTIYTKKRSDKMTLINEINGTRQQIVFSNPILWIKPWINENYYCIRFRDGRINWFQVEDNKMILSLSFLSPDWWVIWTPDGYYSTNNPGNLIHLKWQEKGNNLHSVILDPADEKDGVNYRSYYYNDEEVSAVVQQLFNSTGNQVTMQMVDRGVIEDTHRIDYRIENYDSGIYGAYYMEVYLNHRKSNNYLSTIDSNNKGSISIPVEEARNKEITLKVYNTNGKFVAQQSVGEKNGTTYSSFPKKEINYLGVGINEYLNHALALSLQSSLNDVRDFEKTILNQSLSNSKLLVNRDATPNNVLKEIEKLKNKCSDEDICIFHFSGHGIVREDAFYFLTYGIQSREKVTENAIKMNDFILAINEVPGYKVIFIDACSSGKVIENVFDSPEMEVSNLAIFTSSLEEEISKAGSSLHQSLFTRFLIKGLEKEIDTTPTNGAITLQMIADYLKEIAPFSRQTPQYKSTDMDNLILFNRE